MTSKIEPQFYGPMDPVYPCREMPTRHCPAIYKDVCGERPCARYESDEVYPWIPEVETTKLNEWAGEEKSPPPHEKKEGFIVPLIVTSFFLAWDEIKRFVWRIKD